MHDALLGLVSLARCAELLTLAGDAIDRSALSRYCDNHELKRGKSGREVLVNFEEVREHRSGNYTRQVMTGGKELPPAEPAPAPVQSATVTPIPDRNDPARELKSIQVRRELRDEAAEEGRLTDTAEVDAGVADAIVEMRAAFAEARADLAERLAAELGLPPEKVRQLRAGLKRYDRIGQTRFATRVARTLRDANETATEAHDRLMVLALHAARLRSVKNRAFKDEAVA